MNLFQNVHVAMAILEARTLKVDSANPAMLQLWRRDKSVVGLELLEFLPEIIDQPYPKLIHNVIRTKKSHHEIGAKFYSNNDGRMEMICIDYSYTPILGENGKATSILVVAVDAYEREINRLYMQESDRDLRALVMSSPVAMAIFRGAGFQIESVNDSMFDLWDKNGEMGIRELEHAYHKGVSFTVEIDQLSYSYTPLRDTSGNITGVGMVVNKIAPF